MAKSVNVILTESVKSLGRLGDRKHVKMGYAFNYLIPNGLALAATPENEHIFTSIKKRQLKNLEKAKAEGEKIVAQIHGKTVELAAKIHGDAMLYGSITPGDVAAEIERLWTIKLDKKQLHMPEHIRQLGEYKIVVDLHPELDCELTLVVTAKE
jgi:large subunit ribosomal protein L9